MATFKTRAQLIFQVLDALGILVPGQAPSDEVVSRVDNLLDPVLASLTAQEIVYVANAGTPAPPSGGEIDNAIVLPLANIIAQRVGGAFNLAGDPALAVLSQQGIEELRVIGRPAQTRKTLGTDIQLRAGARRFGVIGNFSRGN